MPSTAMRARQREDDQEMQHRARALRAAQAKELHRRLEKLADGPGRRRAVVVADMSNSSSYTVDLKHAGLMSTLFITVIGDHRYKIEDEHESKLVANHDDVDEETMLDLVDEWLAYHR